MSDFAVQTDRLCRDFSPFRVVDRVSFSLRPGQILALIGPNGAGKTTLLKLLLGLISPTLGTAEVLGQCCFPPSPTTARRIAALLDTHEPPRGTRIVDLIKLKSGTGGGLDVGRAAELIRQRGLGLNKTWHTLSKGQGRWVLSVIALAGNPELLVMDEPADGLDPAARRQLYRLIREKVNLEKTSALVTSHILSDVERVFHLKKLAAAEDPELRKLVLTPIEKRPTPERCELLRNLLEDPDDAVRAEAEKLNNQLKTLREQPLPTRYVSSITTKSV